MNNDLPIPVPASAIFNVFGGNPPLVILLKSLGQMVCVLLLCDRTHRDLSCKIVMSTALSKQTASASVRILVSVCAIFIFTIYNTDTLYDCIVDRFVYKTFLSYQPTNQSLHLSDSMSV